MGANGSLSRGVILVVDDEPAVRLLLRKSLPDWQVVEAADGEAGLAKAREARPDLIIVDWMMPRVNGPQMVKQLRADPALRHVPVVMLTALTDTEHRAETYQSGADHFLAKGFAVEELHAIIDRAVQRTKPLTFVAPLLQALHDEVDTNCLAEIGEAVSLLGEFQQRMLPKGEMRLADLTVGAHLAPSVIASGDFYDYLLWNEGRELGFVIGDVSGHGLAAAYFMVMVRTALRVLCREHCKLSDAFTALNEILLSETPTGWFVTLFYGVADPQSAELKYVSAGHCPALLCHPQGGSKLLDPTGPALGLFHGYSYGEHVVSLAAGAHLVCVTDGVIDAVRSDNVSTRYDWIRQVVSRYSSEGASRIAEALVHGAKADTAGDHRDDLAALVLYRAC